MNLNTKQSIKDTLLFSEALSVGHEIYNFDIPIYLVRLVDAYD